MGLTKLNFSENWVLQNYVFFQPGEPAVLHQLVGQLPGVHVARKEVPRRFPHDLRLRLEAHKFAQRSSPGKTANDKVIDDEEVRFGGRSVRKCVTYELSFIVSCCRRRRWHWRRCRWQRHWQHNTHQRIITYFVRGNVTVQLTSVLTGMESIAMLGLYVKIKNRFPCLVESKWVKQGVSFTVMRPLVKWVSNLWPIY